MAKREEDRKKIVKELSLIVGERIMGLPDNSTNSISDIVGEYYEEKGYELLHLGLDIGYAWTRDKGHTYIIKDFDLLDVFYEVEEILYGYKTYLDMNEYNGCYVGALYNLSFKVRHNFDGKMITAADFLSKDEGEIEILLNDNSKITGITQRIENDFEGRGYSVLRLLCSDTGKIRCLREEEIKEICLPVDR